MDMQENMFDVVIGNPPYQPPVKRKIGDTSFGSGNKIWHKFIEKSFDITHDKSIISLITPTHWRKGNFTNSIIKNAQDLIWSYKFKVNKCTFDNVASHLSIAYFIVDKSKKNDYDEFLQKIKFYPIEKNSNVELIKDFFKAAEEEDCYILNIKQHDSRKYNCIRKAITGDKIHKYRHASSISKIKKENMYDWYSEKTDGFNDKKVIIFTSVRLNSSGKRNKNKIAMYDDGTIGVGHGSEGYIVSNETEGNMLVNFLNNSRIVYDIYCESTGGDSFSVPTKAFSRIPKSFVERFNNGENL